MALSPTQAAILAAALQRPEHLVAPQAKLAPAPREAIRKSLLGKGLIEPVAPDAPDGSTVWTVSGAAAHYRLSAAGQRTAAEAGGAEVPAETLRKAVEDDGAAQGPLATQPAPEPGGTAEGLPAAPARRGLREAADAVLAVWDSAGTRERHLPAAIAALRSSIVGKPPRQPRAASTSRRPRDGTKQQRVLAMLRRPGGATVAQIAEATGWQAHTVRGFFAGLKRRRGNAVEVAERVRQVGPGRESAKGSYSVYRIANAG